MSYGWHKEIWTLSHSDDLVIGSFLSGWLMVKVLRHPDDIRSFLKSSGRHTVCWILCHPDEIAPDHISSGWLITNAGCPPDMTHDVALCHPDGIINLIPRSSGWLSYSQYLIRMTYGHCRMSSGWLSNWQYLIPITYDQCTMQSGWHAKLP